VASDLFRGHAAEGDDFPFNIVNSDETWFYQSDPERRPQSMEWRPKRDKDITPLAAGKVMGPVF
jgi:hypothetical protein